MSARLILSIAGVIVGAIACTAEPSLPPAPTTTVDVTGILIVDVGEQVQGGPVPRKFADAYSDAQMLAEANGNDLGYAWIDPEAEELVVSAVTPRGRELIEAAGITVPYRIRDVQFGAQDLREIQDDVTFLGSRGVENAHLIFMTLPDYRDNRALIVMSAMDRTLLEYLATHYPPEAIAVQIDDSFQGGGPG